MLRAKTIIGCALSLALSGAPMTSPTMADWLLNGMGSNGVYQIYRMHADGFSIPDVALIASPAAVPGAIGVYWPSGVLRPNGELYLYATVDFGNGDRRLGLWTSVDGATFTYWGIVLAAVGDEGAIGSAVALPDPDDAGAPVKLWYGTKTVNGRPTEVRYATSSDGKAFARVGTLYTATGPDEAGGLQLSNIVRDVDGSWRMFFTGANSSVSTFKAIEATAAAPHVPFTRKGVVYAPGGVTREVVGAPARGTRYLTLDSVAGINLGGVYVLGDNSNARQQRVVITRIMAANSAVLLEDPLFIEGAGLALKPIELNKVDPSVFYRDAQGVGRLVLTGWGAFTRSTNEFTFEAVETPAGFVRDGSVPQRFKPFGPGNLLSLENPSLIRSGVGPEGP